MATSTRISQGPFALSPDPGSYFRINNLSTDLLECIFLICVHRKSKQVSPVLLSHVCKHWRVVALGFAQLWTSIDLSDLKRAQHFLRLSQSAVIDVYWRTSPVDILSIGRGCFDESVDRLWEHACRFSKLTLCGRVHEVQGVISRAGYRFSMLSDLTIQILYGFDPNSLSAQVRLTDISTERLRFLCLRGGGSLLNEIISVLDNSPCPEVLELINVSPLATFDAESTVEFVYPPALRRLKLRHIGIASLTAFLPRLRLREECSLSLAEIWGQNDWVTICQPLHLCIDRKLSLTHLKFRIHHMEFIEYNAKGERHSCLHARSYAERFDVVHLGLEHVDLSRLHTLEIMTTKNIWPPLNWNIFSCHFLSVMTVIFSSGASIQEVHRAVVYLPRLQEIIVAEMSVKTEDVENILNAVQERSCHGGWLSRPTIGRIVLHRCEYEDSVIRRLDGAIVVNLCTATSPLSACEACKTR